MADRPCNKLKYIFVHCTATPAGRWVSPEDVKRWHTAPPPVGQGWSRVGYSKLILLDGKLYKPVNIVFDPKTAPKDSIIYSFVNEDDDGCVEPDEITFGAAEYNPISLHICYVGGMSADFKYPMNTMTPKQEEALRELLFYYVREWGEKKGIEFEFIGHNQVHNKACPGFRLPKLLRKWGIPEKYINTRDPFGYEQYFKNLERRLGKK